MFDMLPPVRKNPCGECPWRLISAPGWLGPWTADEWIALAHSDEAIACHTSLPEGSDDMDEDEIWDTEDVFQCAGSASYRKNLGKSPRNPEVITGPVDRENIFTTPMAFKEHHVIVKTRKDRIPC